MSPSGSPMRIGFASIYSWRPHVEHLYFLATLAREAGQQCFFLTCDGDLPTCYTREIRDYRPGWQECLACRIGGVRSFVGKDVSAIGKLQGADLAPEEVIEWCRSSASTLGRFESDADFDSPAFSRLVDRLEPATRKTYNAAREWIGREHLDAVCVFNGRMDATRAIIEAARDSNVRFVSLERTWLGDGLQLLPDESCLGLKSIHAMVRQWRERPLTKEQAQAAASYAAARFMRSNQKEWRAYNTQAQAVGWPASGGTHRILLLPSSRNEVWGHEDWQSNWSEPTAAYDAIIAKLALRPADLVLRCHPNWGEKIGKSDGSMPERYYTEWARRHGIHVIESVSTNSTLGLIEQCDAIVVAGGTAALEAGILGKQIILTDPAMYQEAGFATDASSPEHVDHLALTKAMDAVTQVSIGRETARRSLRFCYTMAGRAAQYSRFVKAKSGAHYDYLSGADPHRLIELLRTGLLMPDDDRWASHTGDEDAVLASIDERNWSELLAVPRSESESRRTVHRRLPFRPLDRIRDLMPIGDR